MCQWASILHVLETSSATWPTSITASPAGKLRLLGLVLSLLCELNKWLNPSVPQFPHL